jgi:protein ImuA
MQIKKADIIAGLQSDILRLQGYKPAKHNCGSVGLGPLLSAFPNSSFPLGAVHEFIATRPEESAATNSFIAGLLSSLMEGSGITLWISASRSIYPPALKNFGVQPERVIFIDLSKEKHVMWALEEALKCSALTAVVGETREISFTASRRLQLAVEESQVTGFIMRRNASCLNTTACVSRWMISPLASESIDNLPGVGFPRWKVELLRVRNGRSCVYDMMWKEGRFHHILEMQALPAMESLKAG